MEDGCSIVLNFQRHDNWYTGGGGTSPVTVLSVFKISCLPPIGICCLHKWDYKKPNWIGEDFSMAQILLYPLAKWIQSVKAFWEYALGARQDFPSILYANSVCASNTYTVCIHSLQKFRWKKTEQMSLEKNEIKKLDLHCSNLRNCPHSRYSALTAGEAQVDFIQSHNGSVPISVPVTVTVNQHPQ